MIGLFVAGVPAGGMAKRLVRPDGAPRANLSGKPWSDCMRTDTGLTSDAAHSIAVHWATGCAG
jgi:hypothetical protein